MKKKKNRFGYIRRMRGVLMAVVLGAHYPDHAGHRVVRILRALYDKELKQVTKVVIRTYGRDPVANGGYNGRVYKLDDRKYFVNGRGQSARGVLHDKSIMSIDMYAAMLLKKELKPEYVNGKPPMAKKKQPVSESFFATEEIKPLILPQAPKQPCTKPADRTTGSMDFFVEDQPKVCVEPADIFVSRCPLPPLVVPFLDADTLSKLSDCLLKICREKPERLKHVGLPDEPRWTIECPDGAIVGLGGYCPIRPTPRPPAKKLPGVATEVRIVEYRPAGADTWIIGSAMPTKAVIASLKKLITTPVLTEKAKPAAISRVKLKTEKKTPPALPPLSLPKTDDYF